MAFIEPLDWLEWSSAGSLDAAPTELMFYAVRGRIANGEAYRARLKERFGEHSPMLRNWDHLTGDREAQLGRALMALSGRLELMGLAPVSGRPPPGAGGHLSV